MNRVVTQAYVPPVLLLPRYDFVSNRIGGVRTVAGALWLGNNVTNWYPTGK
jgi:hypothetical protein